jgi:23S rRNA pseudouridine2605 synthase
MPTRATPRPTPPDDADAPVRLHKYLASAGVASRRACEDMIEAGQVKINGKVVETLPAWVVPGEDLVTVRGKAVHPVERLVYVMLYKPRNCVSTASDPDGRRTVTELVDHPSGLPLKPVGRLDYETMGLMILTNDGELTNRMTHPSFGVHKTYRAIVKGQLTEDDLEHLHKGIYLAVRKEGQTTGAQRTGGARLRIVKREPQRTILDITLAEGRNRQVRRMLAAVGNRVKKLTRITMGPLSLKGLSLGNWRELTPGEVRALKKVAYGGSNPKASATSISKPKPKPNPNRGPKRTPKGTVPRKRGASA